MNFVSIFFNRFLRFVVLVGVVVVAVDPIPKLARVLADVVVAKLVTELANADGMAGSGARGSNMA